MSDKPTLADLAIQAAGRGEEAALLAWFRSKTGPRNFLFGFVAKHRFHFIIGRPRTHVISRLDFGSRVYLRAQWELARSLAERRLLAESANDWVAALASVATCTSMATPSNHERRATPHS